MAVADVRRFVYTPLPEEEQRSLKERLGKRLAETHWHNGARFLLPEYLLCQDKGNHADEAIKPRVDKHLMDLILVSLANYAIPDEDGWCVRFEGRKRLDIHTAGVGLVTKETSQTWFDIYDWAYEGRTGDKMNIVRQLLTLHPYDPASRNYGVVTTHADTIRVSAKHHYDQLVGASVEEYFAKLKEVMGYLQGKIDAVGQQVATLADTLVKTLLATAGFIIGTVLSKVLDSKSSNVSLVILVVFLIYVAVIVGVYYPVTWRTYRLNCEDYRRNEETAKRFLSAEDVSEIAGGAFSARSRLFGWTFWGTAVIYVLLAGLGLWFAWSFQPAHSRRVVRPAPAGISSPSGSSSNRGASPPVIPTPKVSTPQNRRPHNSPAATP